MEIEYITLSSDEDEQEKKKSLKENVSVDVEKLPGLSIRKNKEISCLETFVTTGIEKNVISREAREDKRTKGLTANEQNFKDEKQTVTKILSTSTNSLTTYNAKSCKQLENKPLDNKSHISCRSRNEVKEESRNPKTEFRPNNEKCVRIPLTKVKEETSQSNQNLSNEKYEDSSQDSQSQHRDTMDTKTILKVKKLESTFKKVNQRIKQLEEAEVTSDEEEENSYVMLEKYRKRAIDIYNKLCKLNDLPTDAERPILRKISFSGSTTYPTIFKTLEQRYNKKKVFPDFHEVVRVVTKLSKKDALGYSKIEITKAAREVFCEFGKSLKRLREWDDYTILTEYLENAPTDPADDPINASLITKLNENKKNYSIREKEVIDEFVRKQNEVKETTQEKNEAGKLITSIQDEDENSESSESTSESDGEESNEETIRKRKLPPSNIPGEEKSPSSESKKIRIEEPDCIILGSPVLRDQTNNIISLIDDKIDNRVVLSEKENYMLNLGLCEDAKDIKVLNYPEEKLKINNVISVSEEDYNLGCNIENGKFISDLELISTKELTVVKSRTIKFENVEPEVITLEVVHTPGEESNSDRKNQRQNSNRGKVGVFEIKRIQTPGKCESKNNKAKLHDEEPEIIFDKRKSQQNKFITSSVVLSEVITLD